jgi:hypothetical protein
MSTKDEGCYDPKGLRNKVDKSKIPKPTLLDRRGLVRWIQGLIDAYITGEISEADLKIMLRAAQVSQAALGSKGDVRGLGDLTIQELKKKFKNDIIEVDTDGDEESVA